MNMKSFVFFAAMALVLVGCNKEKEESMENTAVSTEQQQALPVVSNDVVPAAPPAASMPEQGNVDVIGQQAVAPPQTPQEAAAAIPIQQAAPTADLQNKNQPAQPIQSSQLIQAAPVASVTPEPVAPTGSVPVVIPPAAQPVVPHSTMVMADKLAPTQNAPSQIVVPVPDASVSIGTEGAVGQATDVVGTKVSYRKSTTTSDAKSKQDTGSSDNNAVPATPATQTTPTTPDDED